MVSVAYEYLHTYIHTYILIGLNFLGQWPSQRCGSACSTCPRGKILICFFLGGVPRHT